MGGEVTDESEPNAPGDRELGSKFRSVLFRTHGRVVTAVAATFNRKSNYAFIFAFLGS